MKYKIIVEKRNTGDIQELDTSFITEKYYSISGKTKKGLLFDNRNPKNKKQSFSRNPERKMSKRKDPEAKNGIENHTDQSTALTSLGLEIEGKQ